MTGFLNDVWRYRVSDNTWTWISGGNTTGEYGVYGERGVTSIDNVPGARWGALGVYDVSNRVFWLFGGQGNTDSSGTQFHYL